MYDSRVLKELIAMVKDKKISRKAGSLWIAVMVISYKNGGTSNFCVSNAELRQLTGLMEEEMLDARKELAHLVWGSPGIMNNVKENLDSIKK